MPVRKVEDEELLERLLAVFRDHGFEGATLTRLREATGLEKASLYHRFPEGKEEMALAVLDYVEQRFGKQVLHPLVSTAPIQKRVEESGKQVEAFYDGGRHACVLDSLSLAGSPPRLARRVQEIYTAWRNGYQAVAKEAGYPAAEAEQRAENVIMRIHGALVLARALGDREPFRQAIQDIGPSLLKPLARKATG